MFIYGLVICVHITRVPPRDRVFPVAQVGLLIRAIVRMRFLSLGLPNIVFGSGCRILIGSSVGLGCISLPPGPDLPVGRQRLAYLHKPQDRKCIGEAPRELLRGACTIVRERSHARLSVHGPARRTKAAKVLHLRQIDTH